MAVDICYIISHGFTTRMLMQTNLIERLVENGHSVAIISPDITDENLKVLSNNPSVKLVEWTSKTSIWDDDYLHKRMYYLEDIKANTALFEKFYNGLFFSSSKHPWKRVRPLFYYLIYSLVPYFPSLRRKFLENEKKHLASSEAKNILDQVNPKVLVSTYPVSIIEAKLAYEAKRRNIFTIQHLLSWDNISCKGKFPVIGDHFIAWGDIMKEELQQYYVITENQISICGVPHFDHHIAVREESNESFPLKDFDLDTTSPYLFFAMSSPRFAPREIDIVLWLADAIEKNKFGDKMQLVVRPHPQNVSSFMAKESWLDRLEKVASKRVAIDYPKLIDSKIRWSMKEEDMHRLSMLIAGCAICFNSGSTVSIDALLHNKPVIITSFDGVAKLPYWNSARRLIDYAHLKKYIKEGGAVTVKSYEELIKAVQQYLNDPFHDLSKRRSALFRECYLDDGNATERVTNTISSLVQNLE